MIPKKVRKILSIMIAVTLVMAVFPAVSFADDGFFGNGEVASAGDAEATTDEETTTNEETVPQVDEQSLNQDLSQTDDETETPENEKNSEDLGANDIEVELANINMKNNQGSLDSIRRETDWTYGFSTDNCDDMSEDNKPIYYEGGSDMAPDFYVYYKGQPASSSKYRVKYSNTLTGEELTAKPTSEGFYSIVVTINRSQEDGDDVSMIAPYIIKAKFAVEVCFHGTNKSSTEIATSIRKTVGDTITDSDIPSAYKSSVPKETVLGYRIGSSTSENLFEIGSKIKGSQTEFNSSEGKYYLHLYTKWHYCNDTLEEVAAKAATCTEDGNIRYYKCTFDNCGKHYSDVYANYYLSEDDIIIPPKGHTLTHHERVEATCQSAGNIEYWSCSVCNKNFSDSGATTVADNVTIPVDPDAHNFGEATYTWSNNYKECTGERTCSLCSQKTIGWTSDVEEVVALEPTCTEPGTMKYTAKYTNKDFTNQTAEVEIPAIGHDWGSATYTWSSDNSKVTAKRVCNNDAKHIETETVNTSKNTTKEATETEPGDAIYTAEFENPVFEKQTKYVEIPAKGSSEKQPEEKKSEEPTADEEAFYINATGAKITWTAGSKDTLNIKFERSEDNASTSKHFLGIEVDGKATSKDLYDTEDGSIIIKLKPALLESLGEGEHTLTALFDDGSASAKFTIIKATKEVKNEKKTTSKNAKTGDASPIKLVIIIMIVSALACAGVLVIKKKRQ